MLSETVVVGLAAWRLCSLFLIEDGPWYIFKRIRVAAHADFEVGTGFFAVLLTCVYCFSVWAAVGAILLFEFLWPVAMILAASTLAIGVDTLHTRLRRG